MGRWGSCGWRLAVRCSNIADRGADSLSLCGCLLYQALQGSDEGRPIQGLTSTVANADNRSQIVVNRIFKVVDHIEVGRIACEHVNEGGVLSDGSGPLNI